MRWRCCDCRGVGSPRWDSGLGRRRGGVGRVRRLGRHPRAARRSTQIKSGCFLRIFNSRAHRRRTNPRQLISRFRFRCQLCWRGRRNAARGLVVLARVDFKSALHVTTCRVSWLFGLDAGGEMRGASSLPCQVLKLLWVCRPCSSARRLENAANDRQSRSV